MNSERTTNDPKNSKKKIKKKKSKRKNKKKEDPKPANPHKILENFAGICHTHGKPIEYLCETCNELACEDCFFDGPHATPIHLGRSIHVIKKERINKLKNNINMNIRKLETDYLERMRMCDRAHLETRYLSQLIQDKTRMFFEGLVHLTKSKNLENLAKINKSHSMLQGDLDLVQRIIVESNYLVKHKRVAMFLQQYKSLQKHAEFLGVKKYECKSLRIIWAFSPSLFSLCFVSFMELVLSYLSDEPRLSRFSTLLNSI